MALFENDNILRCEKCGSTVFTERNRYIYERKKGRILDAVIRENIGTALECANPDCRHTIDTNTSDFFKDAELVKVDKVD